MTQQHPLDRAMDWKTLLRFSLPNIAILVTHSSYTIIDGIFVSHVVGPLALSALNMVFPVIGIIFGLAFMLAIGGSALVARLQGEGQGDRSRGIFSLIVLTALGLALGVAVGGSLFIDELVQLCHCTPAQYELGKIYLLINLWFAPAFMLQMTFQMFFTAAGKPKLGLYASLMAGLTNIGLDYLFITHYGWGLAGAAWATGLGASLAMLFGLLYFGLNRRSEIRLVRPIWSPRDLLRTCTNGSSEMVSSLASSIITFLFNYHFLRLLGEDGVAAISIAMYFQFLFTGIFYGFAEGVSPLISYQLGRRNATKLKQALQSSLKILGSLGILTFSISVLSLNTLLPLFVSPSLPTYKITIQGFPIFAIAFIYMWFSVFCSAFFTALNNGVVSASIALGRNIILGLVLLTLPQILGITGLWLSLPVAELLSCLMALYYLRSKRSTYGY